MSKAKVLVVGDVCGRLPALEARLKAVNDSHGPFAAAFCVGDFAGGDWSCIGEAMAGSARLLHAAAAVAAPGSMRRARRRLPPAASG